MNEPSELTLIFHTGEVQTLSRLQLAIDSNQKQFVTHPSVQQLLAAIWYDGLPGFRRLHIIKQVMTIAKVRILNLNKLV